jgi:hypothetical protein
MKKFKIIDTWMSIGLIIIFIIYSLVRLDYIFLYGYFTIGTWQIISMIVHIWNHWFTNKGGTRSFYHGAVAVLLILAIVGMVVSPILYLLLFVLLFAAPFMAVYYARLCYQEVYVKMQRPLALLK